MSTADVFRTDPPTAAGERELLQGFLDFHRGTLLWKVSGLTSEQLVQRAVDPSSMSLIGLVRHLSEVEKYWFHRALAQGRRAEVLDRRAPGWRLRPRGRGTGRAGPRGLPADVRTSDELAARYALDDTFTRPNHEGDYSSATSTST